MHWKNCIENLQICDFFCKPLFFSSRETFEAFASGLQGGKHSYDASSLSPCAPKDIYKYTEYVSKLLLHIIKVSTAGLFL